MIPSRTVVQIRTHAQKYFQKLSKGEGGRHEEFGTPSPVKHEKKKVLKLPRYTVPAPSHHDTAKDVSAAAGGITPRTYAAATILLAPRIKEQSQSKSPESQWFAKHSEEAMQALEFRKSPRPSIPTDWPINGAQPISSPQPPPPTLSPPLESTESPLPSTTPPAEEIRLTPSFEDSVGGGG